MGTLRRTRRRGSGFVIEKAHDGREGVAKAIEFLPAIIITDLAMPVMDGWETIRRLRADHRTRAIPIIACTGEDAPSGMHDCWANCFGGVRPPDPDDGHERWSERRIEAARQAHRFPQPGATKYSDSQL
jgi:CheY-like chemotaxis protein